jgi:hypothetical protein
MIMNMYTPHVFIGSSTEALKVAEHVQQFIAKNIAGIEVQLWNKDTFQFNTSTLENLLRNADTFDFGVFIFSSDDIISMREKTSTTPRDNVVFEQGLFLGRIGPRRSFVLCDKRVEHILSDYKGITIAFYDSSSDLNLKSSVEDGCKGIVSAIQAGIGTSEFTAFPSTALAIGYFENFLRKALEVLYDVREVTVGSRLFTVKAFELNILIPEELGQIGPIPLKKKSQKLTQIRIPSSARDFPLFISALPELEKGKLELVDIPSTLFTSRMVTNYLLPDRTISDDATKNRMEAREIRNFKQTLELLIKKEFPESEGEIKIRWMSEAKDLFA